MNSFLFAVSGLVLMMSIMMGVMMMAMRSCTGQAALVDERVR